MTEPAVARQHLGDQSCGVDKRPLWSTYGVKAVTQLLPPGRAELGTSEAEVRRIAQSDGVRTCTR